MKSRHVFGSVLMAIGLSSHAHEAFKRGCRRAVPRARAWSRGYDVLKLGQGRGPSSLIAVWSVCAVSDEVDGALVSNSRAMMSRSSPQGPPECRRSEGLDCSGQLSSCCLPQPGDTTGPPGLMRREASVLGKAIGGN